MKHCTACFTGHRNLNKCEMEKIKALLNRVILELIIQGYRYFGSGGARGFDTMAALTVLELKKDFPHIRLILVLPCENQTNGWNTVDIKMYNYIKTHADKTVYTSKKYFSGCMQKRNRHLVDNSSVCICYLNKQYGGTLYTVRYAKLQGLRILNLATQKIAAST